MAMSDLEARWSQVWAEQVASVEQRSGVLSSEWRSAGRKSKANPEGEDFGFWQGEGLRQVETYLDWYERSGWKIATMPDGKPGIEWEAEVDFAGSHVRLIVDAVYTVNLPPWVEPTPDTTVVVDYKTGSRNPASGPVQLGLYASAMEKVYGFRPKWGAIYMSRKGEIADLIDLSPWSIEFYEYQFSAMDAQLATGYLPPAVGDHCGFCSFRDYCVAVGGSKASEYPLTIHKKEK